MKNDKTPYEVWKKRLEKQSSDPSPKAEKLLHEYDGVRLVIDGKEKRVSRSSKYLLDMMISDD